MRYHFEIRAPLFLDPDPEGEEFASMEAACEHALETMRQYLASRDVGNLNLVENSTIEISDETGITTLLPLADVIAELMHKHKGSAVPRGATIH